MTEVLVETETTKAAETQILPVLPLKGTVIYPFLVVPLMINQAEQTRMVDEALMRGSRIGLFLQKDPENDDPGPDDLYHVRRYIRNSLFLFAFSLFDLVFAFVVAYILTHRPRFANFFRVVYFLPSILAMSATVLLWSKVLHPISGILSQLLRTT